MKITAIELKHVKGFKNLAKTGFSEKINLLVGPNNSGKSTIIDSISLLQYGGHLRRSNITIGETEGEVILHYTGSHHPWIPSAPKNYNRFHFDLFNSQRRTYGDGNSHMNLKNAVPNTEPNNLIYPFLSKRKAVTFENTINVTNANSVLGNFTNLYSKIDRLITPQFQPANKEYIKACNDILNFEISTIASGAGKEAVLYIHNSEHIPLTEMGEGVTNIIGLISDLCIAESKIFLIEEPENDIHPKALKALLNLIAEKSEKNQFFISTHSNIVMKNLGAVEGSKIFKISNHETDESRPMMRLSKMEEVGNSPADRQLILEELGYDFFDLDLWKAWIFLEESSAEVIIRDYLIKWFCPDLGFKLRTFSAGSTSKIKMKFDDFNKLFVFLHLEPTYKNKVWVVIDAGEMENEIIDDFKRIYTPSGWKESNFLQFSQHDFEKYYPERFQEEVSRVLAIENKKEKREAKKNLLDAVKTWISEKEETAKAEFKESAAAVIRILESIASELSK